MERFFPAGKITLTGKPLRGRFSKEGADRAEALEFRVMNDPAIVGIPLEKLRLKDNLLVACINRNGRIRSPRGKDVIETGDRVIIVTTNTGLNDLKDILK